MEATDREISTEGTIVRVAARLSVVMNIPPNAARDRELAMILLDSDWTVDEVRTAEREIIADPELLAMVRRAGAVTVEPFAEWRRKREARPTLGQCFTFGCRTPATIAAWGEIYCAPCHSGHVARHAARDAALHRPKGQKADDTDSCKRLADLLPDPTAPF